MVMQNTVIRTPRKSRIWGYKVEIGNSHTAGTPASINLLDDFQTAFGNIGNLTVVRIVGNIYLGATTPGAGVSRATMGVVKTGFVAANTDIDPEDDTHQNDWLWRAQLGVQNAAYHDGTNYQAKQYTLHIDSKGKRKLQDRDVLRFVIDAGTNLTWGLSVSILLLR